MRTLSGWWGHLLDDGTLVWWGLFEDDEASCKMMSPWDGWWGHLLDDELQDDILQDEEVAFARKAYSLIPISIKRRGYSIHKIFIIITLFCGENEKFFKMYQEFPEKYFLLSTFLLNFKFCDNCLKTLQESPTNFAKNIFLSFYHPVNYIKIVRENAVDAFKIENWGISKKLAPSKT